MIINYNDTIICPNCGQQMQAIDMDEYILYQHNQPFVNCILAIRKELVKVQNE